MDLHYLAKCRDKGAHHNLIYDKTYIIEKNEPKPGLMESSYCKVYDISLKQIINAHLTNGVFSIKRFTILKSISTSFKKIKVL